MSLTKTNAFLLMVDHTVKFQHKECTQIYLQIGRYRQVGMYIGRQVSWWFQNSKVVIGCRKKQKKKKGQKMLPDTCACVSALFLLVRSQCIHVCMYVCMCACVCFYVYVISMSEFMIFFFLFFCCCCIQIQITLLRYI